MPIDFTSLVKNHCIALTGGAATGKSAVADLIRQNGYLVFDADQFARTAVEPGKPALKSIVARFGASLLDSHGRLDRAALRKQVLSDKDSRLALEAIMHPAIRQEFAEAASKSDLISRPRTFFYEAALIFETGRENEFKEIWCTFCPPNQQLERLTTRHPNPLDQLQAQELLDIQMPAAKKASQSQVVIDTSTSLQDVQARIQRLLSERA